MLLLSAGNTNDIAMARALVEAAGPARRLIADRGYDANHLREFLAARDTEVVIPSTTSRRAPIPYDAEAYKARNLVERMWCRLKDWRRVTTSSPETSSQRRTSPPHSPIGSIESGP